MRPISDLAEPWKSFLNDLDGGLPHSMELHCLGGFVVVHHYGLERPTVDIDILTAATSSIQLQQLAGRGSDLHSQHGIYLDLVTVAIPPVEYETRLAAMFPGRWSKLTLQALEAHDLALTKITRDQPKDRQDVLGLARAGHLEVETLEQRYYEELRPYLLSRESWHDLTLKFWIEAIEGLKHDKRNDVAPAPSEPEL